MLEKLKQKKDELNDEIKKKSKEFEKTFRKPEKIKMHSDLLRLEGKYEAYVEIIRMLEQQNKGE